MFGACAARVPRSSLSLKSRKAKPKNNDQATHFAADDVSAVAVASRKKSDHPGDGYPATRIHEVITVLSNPGNPLAVR